MADKDGPQNNNLTGSDQHLSPSRWETLKPVIQYLLQRIPLTSLMSVMEQDYSFKASRDQYESQLRQWGLGNRVRPRKGMHSRHLNLPDMSVRDNGTLRSPIGECRSNDIKKTFHIPIRERNRRRKIQPVLNELPESPKSVTNPQMALPPVPDIRKPSRTSPVDVDTEGTSDADDDGNNRCSSPSISSTPYRLLHIHDDARWSILHRALLLGVIRGKMLPHLYPMKAAMFSDQFLGSSLTFTLMKIFEALTFIEQHQCGLEELLLTAYLITNNTMTPPTSTVDATWAKIGFLALGKACSVLKDLESSPFREKQASDFAHTLLSKQYLDDAWSRKYVSLLADEDLARYNVNDWEDKMFKVIENLMHFASCSPDWRSIKVQTQLQIQHEKTQTVVLNSMEA